MIIFYDALIIDWVSVDRPVAHCVQNKRISRARQASDSTFYLGKYNLNSLNEIGYVNADVDSFLVHPDWDPNEERYEGDIALAVLSKTVEFADNIIPLCIWQQSYSHTDLNGKQGLIAGLFATQIYCLINFIHVSRLIVYLGWGITGTGKISEIPMYISLPVVEDGECLRSKEVFSKITSKSNFCVGDKSGRAPCQGKRI